MNEVQVSFYPNETKHVTIICEIAKSLRAKMQGLMNRISLPEGTGIIFSFLIPGHRLFWMKNVIIPLDIIFINRKLEIIYIHEAPVENGIFHKIYWSHGFCKYVVETNMGFCKKNNILKGTKINFDNINIKKEN
jgi:uncharacterized membrane protein (UPF0127 family)